MIFIPFPLTYENSIGNSPQTPPSLKDQPQPSILASSHLPGSSDHPCNSKILDPSSRPQPFAALGGIISFYKPTGQQLTQTSTKKNLGKKKKKTNKKATTSSACVRAQSCPSLCDPMDCSLPGSSVHGILQARILEWVAYPFSRGSSQPRNQTWVSCIAGGFFTN